MTLLGIDTESGGISTDYDLLTLTMSIVKDYEIVSTLDLKIKPDPVDSRTEFFVQAEALRVNGIDLGQHDLEAIPYRQSKQIIFSWLSEAKEKHGKLLPFGNGVSRDIQLITKYTISPKAWEMNVARNPIELTSLGNNFKMLGLIPKEQSLSLSNLAEYFGVEVDKSKTHTAEYDVWLGIQVLKGYNSFIK
jgi:hypothetical protein